MGISGRKKGQYSTIEKECEYCKSKFTVYPPSRFDKAKFCTRKCASRWQKSNKKYDRPGWITIQCKHCKSDFYIWKHEADKRKFCCRDCYTDFQAKLSNQQSPGQKSGLCKICANEFFYYESARPNANYCSNECRQKDHGSKVKGLNSSQWLSDKRSSASVRILAKNHLGDKCAICGWDEACCDAHHIVSTKSGGKHILSNIIILCPNHHRMTHKGLITQDELLVLWHKAYDSLQLDDALIN